MGQSTNGLIAFGFSFEEDFEFPWGEDDPEDWWAATKGYKPSVELFTAEGGYIGGVEPSREATKAYFAEKHAWQEANPMPVEIVSHCSGDYPMYILAVPETSLSARRGYPVEFDPATLTVTPKQIEALAGFCREFCIKTEGDPKWWLASWWN